VIQINPNGINPEGFYLKIVPKEKRCMMAKCGYCGCKIVDPKSWKVGKHYDPETDTVVYLCDDCYMRKGDFCGKCGRIVEYKYLHVAVYNKGTARECISHLCGDCYRRYSREKH